MSKARQSKRQRYRKPRADYQAGGRVNVFRGGKRFDELDAIMTGRRGRKIPKRKNTTTPKPTQTLKKETTLQHCYTKLKKRQTIKVA